MTESAYLLASGPELERVRLQARMWEPESERLFDAIGIAPGATCLDLGCGGYGVLGPLSRRVRAGGRVIGIDRDPLQLASARAYVAEAGLGNVEIVDADAYASGLPRECADLVHVRFLFAPVGRDTELLTEMTELARPGGTVVIQEPDAAAWRCWPELDVWTQLKTWILAAFRAGGGDFDAGRRTYAMLVEGGFEDVRARAAVLALPGAHPYARLPVQFAASLEERIVGLGLATAEEIKAAREECDRQLQVGGRLVTSFVVTQVWGRKPQRSRGEPGQAGARPSKPLPPTRISSRRSSPAPGRNRPAGSRRGSRSGASRGPSRRRGSR